MVRFIFLLSLVANSLLALDVGAYWKAWTQMRHPREGIDRYFDDLFFSLMIDDPQAISWSGAFDALPLKEHNAYLTDVSPKALLNRFGVIKSSLAKLQTFPIDSLSEEEKTSVQVIQWDLEHQVKGDKYLFHTYVVNQMWCLLHHLTLLFTQHHKLENSEDVDNYIARLGKIPEQIDQTIEMMERQKKIGVAPPAFALEKVVMMIQKATPSLVFNHPFYLRLKEGPSDEKQLGKAAKILEKKVYPAYKKLAEYCQKFPTKGNRGVWSLPDGDNYYAYILKTHTTTDLTPDEIHLLGQKEVERIQRQMRNILAAVGMADEAKEVGELMSELAKDPQFYFPDTAEGRAQCLELFEKILARSRTELYPLFDLKPKADVKVAPVPEHETDGAPGAYYCSPSLDGSRPGVFFANLDNMEALPRFHMETLAIHEGEPGHHFQISLQQDMDIPMLRKFSSQFTAYVEGWALYTEKLAFEQGFYSSPYSELGHLQDELFRAARLVVDTGIHHKRWTREEAIDYMRKTTGEHLARLTSEVERYFVCPGQACAYKIGQLKILALRAKAKEALGAAFDIKQFHNAILQLGAAPLAVLESKIDEYIEKCRMQKHRTVD